MIVLGIGLSVLLIAFLFIQVYPFHEKKLEQRKYDDYGIWIIICTGVCLYVSQLFLQNFQLDVLENNAYMIFNTKGFHSRKNDVSDLFVIDFEETFNIFGIE